MATDTERREVAARLRDLRPSACFDDVYEALGAYGPSPYESRGLSATGLARRLADLIEPSCDRDALLALAEEFDAKADDIAAYIESCDGYFDEAAAYAERENREHADRIREALGVQDV